MYNDYPFHDVEGFNDSIQFKKHKNPSQTLSSQNQPLKFQIKVIVPLPPILGDHWFGGSLVQIPGQLTTSHRYSMTTQTGF